MREKLNKWIIEQLEEREWSQRELGRQSGLTGATVSNVLAGHTQPTWDFCAAIARAFGQPPEKVFRLAGLLTTPDESNLTDDEKEWLRLYQSLPEGLPRKYALIMMRAWVAQTKDYNEDEVGG